MSEIILITTSHLLKIEPNTKMLFAGEWCLNYFQKTKIPEALFKINKYHWDDLAKRESDYHYLNKLFDQLITSLAQSLNTYHGVNESNRYWQIIIGPWLYHYLSVMYDRWEVVNSLNFDDGEYISYISNRVFSAPYDYTDFITMSQNDEWNNKLFHEVFLALDNKKVIFKPFPTNQSDKSTLSQNAIKPWEKPKKRGVVLRVITIIDKVLSSISSRSPIVIYDSPFRPGSLLKLFYSLKLIPRLYLKDFDLIQLEPPLLNINGRLNLSNSLRGTSNFESFLFKRLSHDIPIAYLEGFNINLEATQRIMLSPKVILSGSSHWHNELFKVWVAEKVKLDVKFVVAIHGGCFPAKFEGFLHEETISNHFLCWARPLHTKHIRVPPSKPLLRKFKKQGVNLLVIGLEIPKYAYHVTSGYISGNILVNIEMIKSLYKGLNLNIQDKFILRNYSNAGWDSETIFKAEFGESKVNRNGKLIDAYEASKLIICTYPETTYQEAMQSGIPTVLIYDDSLWKIHEAFTPILDLLKRNNMVFNSSKSAAIHINNIWDDPYKWWHSKDVLECREEFSKAVGDLSGGINKWKNVLNGILNNLK